MNVLDCEYVCEAPPDEWKLTPNDGGAYTVWYEVVIANEYRLPDSFQPDDVIVDIGSHVGVFAWACLIRGAGHVICVEPKRDNYLKSLEILEPFRDRVTMINAAIWSSHRWLHLCDMSQRNISTGFTIGELMEEHTGEQCIGIPLYEVMPDHGRCRLLKIDCEGSEWEMMRNCTLNGHVGLRNFDEVIGEIHMLRDGETAKTWSDLMAQHGFNTEFSVNPEYPYLSLFWCRKDNGKINTGG